MQKKRILKIISVVLIVVLICISITYFKNDSKVALATTKEFNSENLQDNEHMHVEIDNSGDKVPVPNGYVGSKATGENEIDTGYVIYEGEEEVNDDNVEEAQKTRNQYVWIPVPDASTMYGTDSNGKKWGKLYDFTTDMGDNINPVTGAKPLNWSENAGVMKITNTNSNREPGTLLKNGTTLYDTDVVIKEYETKNNTLHKLLNQLEKDFNSMIGSIEKYGGFYIGRYETGNLSKEQPVIRKDNTDIGNQTWYTMFLKLKNLSDNNTNIRTGMIWGNQWDRTLMWLIESRSKTKEQICDSTSWGNYRGSTIKYGVNNAIKESGKVQKIPTGSSEETKTNNIYDLAGNVSDWSIEAGSLMHRILRGGNMQDTGHNVCGRAVLHPIGKFNHIGCRAMLYIK